SRGAFLKCFFSSRRRHTRFSRDWSSDVCSSDLPPRFSFRELHHSQIDWRREQAASLQDYFRSKGGKPDAVVDGGWPFQEGIAARSEERRVGKGWRSGWSLGS